MPIKLYRLHPSIHRTLVYYWRRQTAQTINCQSSSNQSWLCSHLTGLHPNTLPWHQLKPLEINPILLANKHYTNPRTSKAILSSCVGHLVCYSVGEQALQGIAAAAVAVAILLLPLLIWCLHAAGRPAHMPWSANTTDFNQLEIPM